MIFRFLLPWILLALSALVFVALDLAYQAVFGDLVVHAQLNMGVLRIIPEFLYGIGLYRLGQRVHLPRPHAIGAASAALLFRLTAHPREWRRRNTPLTFTASG